MNEEATPSGDETTPDENETAGERTDQIAPELGDDSHPNREAARYRVKLREVETERDHLATKLEAVQRTQVEDHITGLGLKPAALWATGAELADLLTDDGTVDAQRVQEAATNARDLLGIHSSKPKTGLRSGASTHRQQVNGWREAFAPRRHDD